MPPYIPGSHDDFCELVVPELQRRNLFRTEYEGKTLRDNLGLPRPDSVHTRTQPEKSREHPGSAPPAVGASLQVTFDEQPRIRLP